MVLWNFLSLFPPHLTDISLHIPLNLVFLNHFILDVSVYNINLVLLYVPIWKSLSFYYATSAHLVLLTRLIYLILLILLIYDSIILSYNYYVHYILFTVFLSGSNRCVFTVLFFSFFRGWVFKVYILILTVTCTSVHFKTSLIHHLFFPYITFTN